MSMYILNIIKWQPYRGEFYAANDGVVCVKLTCNILHKNGGRRQVSVRAVRVGSWRKTTRR